MINTLVKPNRSRSLHVESKICVKINKIDSVQIFNVGGTRHTISFHRVQVSRDKKKKYRTTEGGSIFANRITHAVPPPETKS